MSDDAENYDPTTFLKNLYWWGVPTLFRCDHDPDLNNCDVALVGVPHSTGNGTTERDQHLGPRAVRDVSAFGRRMHSRFHLDPWVTARINDLGDVPLTEGNNNERCIEDITAFYKKIDEAGVRPVSIGGDHSITGGILEAISGSDAKLTKGKKAALVHFDAHTDTFENMDHFFGARKSAAHWGAYLVRNGYVDAEKSIQIGIRGNIRTFDWLKSSEDLGYEVVTMDRFEEMGETAVIELIKKRVGDSPVYVTFDLDCLDPTVAPAVANLEPGYEGFRMNQVMRMLQCMQGLDVIGGDVVCLMPTKDQPNKITAMVAMAVMFEILCLAVERIRTSDQATC